MFEDRQYQIDCVEAWYRALIAECFPLVAVPTGAGKTIILCRLIQKWIDAHPDSNILVLSHTKEIVQQDYEALSVYFPRFGLGIYSAGIGEKQVRKITVGGIQSVYKHPELFSKVDLVIIDEVHSVNHKNSGMYRTLLGQLNAKLGGMSATIYRTGHGYIHQGADRLFDTVAYDLTSLVNFNKLVRDGYLTKLLSKAPECELDSTGVKKTGGDYNIKALADKHDRSEITNAAISEVIATAGDYKKWLVFAIDIAHCEHIWAELVKQGINAQFLHSQMDHDRDRTLDRFKYGSTRALVSVGMVTTGFDAPNVDLIVLLRPTLSPVLHVQMIGRGLRIAPGKDHCLVLDFAGNTDKLGPINNPIVKGKQQSDSGAAKGEPPTKKCPECRCINFAIARYCEMCGFEFTYKTKLKPKAIETPVVQGDDANRWLPVDDVMYNIHNKIGKPPSLKVSYICGKQVFNEWVCFNHNGYAREKAVRWAERRLRHELQLTTENVYRHSNHLEKPKFLKVKRGKYVTITNTRF